MTDANEAALGETGVYSYNSLQDPKSQIRLLFLHPPNKESEDAFVRGTLIHTELSAAPDYIALSYTWGKETATESLSLFACYGCQQEGCCYLGDLPITTNLSAVLRRMSRQEIGPIWVDAICIDQSNHLEKGHQVYRMDKIYSQAAMVAIWLGEGEENGRLAGELSKLHDEICTESGHAGFVEKVKDYRSHWRAVSSIPSHPWFRRRWVIQEAVLGSSKLFLWSSYSMCWHCFVALTRDLRSLDISDHDRSENRIEGDEYGLETLGALDLAQRSIESKRQKSKPTETTVTVRQTQEGGTLSTSSSITSTNVLLSLETLLKMFATAQVSDTRDLIYSLIALAADVDDEEWLPDYSQENMSAVVFMKALRHIIATNQDIDVLCRSAVFRPGSPLPSASGYNLSLPKIGCESCVICGHRNRSLTTFASPVWDGPTKVYSASGQIPHYCIVSADTMGCPSRSGPHLQVEVLGSISTPSEKLMNSIEATQSYR